MSNFYCISYKNTENNVPHNIILTDSVSKVFSKYSAKTTYQNMASEKIVSSSYNSSASYGFF